MHINFSFNRTVPAKQLKPWQGILFGIIFIIFGILFLFISISTIKTYNEKNKTYIETNSKVVDYEYNEDGLQAIVVEYVVNGETYKKVSNTYSNMPQEIGTVVLVKYNPVNPQDAIWSSDSTNIIFPIVSVVFILTGVIVIIISIKKRKNEKITEEQVIEQDNGLYNNVNVQQQVNNINSQVQQPVNNIGQPQINNYNQDINQPINNNQIVNQSINNNVLSPMNNYNQMINQPINNIGKSQINNNNQTINQPINNTTNLPMNSYNQPNSNINTNNQNNNINTNL